MRNAEESTGKEEVRMMIREENGYKYVQAERNILTGDDPLQWETQIENYINESIRKGEDVVFPTDDGHFLVLTERSAYKLSDRHKSAIADEIEEFLSDEDYYRKGMAAAHIDELIQVGKFRKYREDVDGKHENDIGEDGFNYFTAFFKDFDGKYYKVSFSSALNEDSETVYSIGNIRKRRLPNRRGSSPNGALKNGRKSSNPIIYISEGESQDIKAPYQKILEDLLKQGIEEGSTQDKNRRNQERDDEYLSAVKSGDMVTARRMVNEAASEAGYDMHLYHGAKSGGGFTVFKDWQYFTDDKEYAEKYTQRNTSDKSLYDVYVRADRLLDTRKPADRAVYEQYKQEYGMSDLEESGLPSWIDGYDLSEIIDENGLDYDGIILDEGTQYYENGKTYNDKFRRVLSYVIKESSQIKSADTVTYHDNGNLIPLSKLFSFIGQLIRTTRLPRGFCYTNPNGRVRKPCRLNKNRNQNAWKTLILL